MVTWHLEALDREWDLERRWEANAAVVRLPAVGLSMIRRRRWMVLPAVVPAFLLQHAVQAWWSSGPSCGLTRAGR